MLKELYGLPGYIWTSLHSSPDRFKESGGNTIVLLVLCCVAWLIHLACPVLSNRYRGASAHIKCMRYVHVPG